MPIQNLGQFIQAMATKAGVPADDANLIAILANADTNKIIIHEDLSKAIDENLLSLSVAKGGHPEIKKTYFAQALNGFDATINEIAGTLGLEDTDLAALKAMKSTNERFNALVKKVSEINEAKVTAAKKEAEDAGKATDDDAKTALKAQVQDLLGKLKEADRKYKEVDQLKATEIENLQKEHSAYKANQQMKLLIAGIGKTIYDDLDPKDRIMSIETIINNSLQDKDAELYLNDKEELCVRKKDGTSLVGANHTEYNPKQLIDEIAAQKKILKVSDTKDADDNANTNNNGGQNRTTNVNANREAPKGNNQTAQLNRKQREAAEKTSAAN
jgi:hypothetical protein